MRATERVRRQIETAAQIQRRMLPSEPPRHPGLTFGCVYAPTLLVGGDFYDFITLSSGALGVCIADVVGKGFPAALMMASLRSVLRTRARGTDDLALLMAEVNRDMCCDTLIGEFATLVYGVFSPDGRSLYYCNAGHTPPLLLRGDELETLEPGGTVIGVDLDAVFETETIPVRPSDVLVMMTDGVTEALAFDGSSYGQERLEDSIRRHRSLNASALAGAILWDVRRFVGLADQSDDITIVVVKAE